MNDNYLIWRNTYYASIFLLVIYAMPAVDFVTKYLYPLFHAELVPKLPVVTAIALFTGISAYMAFRYRKLG